MVMATFGLNAAIAQTTPTIVVVRFQTDYPKIVPAWTSDDCYYRVEYLDEVNNTWRSIVYDRAGYIVCRDWKMENNYPVRISDYYSAVYPGEKFVVWSSINENGCQHYYIVRNAEKMWFDKNGKVVNYTLASR